MPQHDLSGAVLDGRYRVIEPIADGAMGSVYRGERLKLGRAVAIKIMHDALPDELASRQRFEREAKLMARLEHPHCVSVIDFGVHADKPFLVMDLVRGTSLLQLLESQGRFEIARAVEIVRQVLSGLAHAHELGIIHRDIKPANIMLTEKTGLGEQIRILDFGLARPASEGAKLTAGIVVGTPNYMAPEQIKGGDIDGRADLYACGVLLFELLTGYKPFIAGDPFAVVRKHLHDPPPKLVEIVPAGDFGELEAVVARTLAKTPAERYATATEMSAALERVMASRGSRSSQALEPSAPIPVPGAASPSPHSGQHATASGWSVPPSDPAVAAPAIASAPVPAPATHARNASHPIPRLRLTRNQLLIAGGVLGLVLVMLIAAMRSDGAKAQTPIDAGVAPIGHVDAAVPDPVAPALGRASDLYANGELEPALAIVSKARRQHPESAQLAFLGGKIYFAKLWWTDGIQSFRDSIRLDPGYRADPELIKIVVRGFVTTPDTNAQLADFLKDDIGVEAKAVLEEAARTYRNPSIRSRLATELRRFD